MRLYGELHVKEHAQESPCFANNPQDPGERDIEAPNFGGTLAAEFLIFFSVLLYSLL